MAFRRPFVRLAVVIAAITSYPREAAAQLHWDASLGVGIDKRFLADRPAGGADASFGPSMKLAAHVALLPLVRVGGYVGYELSPLEGDAAPRSLASGGVRAKVMSPWPRGAMRAYLFAGFGYVSTYARSYRTTLLASSTPGAALSPRDALVHGSTGGFFEVPFGLGASYRLRRPWELFAELGMRVGFGATGGTYEEGSRVSFAGLPDSTTLPRGDDRVAVGLCLGVLVDL